MKHIRYNTLLSYILANNNYNYIDAYDSYFVFDQAWQMAYNHGNSVEQCERVATNAIYSANL